MVISGRSHVLARGGTVPEQANLGWTLDTLRIYFEQRFTAQEAAVRAAIAAADRATSKAEAASEKRFEGVNEFRAALSDQQLRLIPRAEVIALIAALEDKVEVTQRGLEALLAERRGIVGGWGWAVGILGFVAFVLSLLRSGMLRTP